MAKEKSNNIWMPIYWDRYDKDTTRLTLQEHGAYLMLIKEYWINEAPLPDNRDRIYRATSAMTTDEKLAIDSILSEYFILRDGFWHHNKIDEQLSKAIELRKKKSAAGKKGMDARYNPTITPVITKLVTNEVTKPLTKEQQPYNQLQSQLPSVDDVGDDIDIAKLQRFRSLSDRIQKIVNSAIPLNTQRVHSWVTSGADDELICETITAVMAKSGATSIRSLNYFDGAIATAIHNKNNPLNMEKRNGSKPKQKHSGFSQQDYLAGTKGFIVG